MPRYKSKSNSIPDDDKAAYDFGLGAGFYLNATESPWSENYRMYDYIVYELPAVIESLYPVDSSRVSISGHSMGGHGVLTIGLRNLQIIALSQPSRPYVRHQVVHGGEKHSLDI